MRAASAWASRKGATVSRERKTPRRPSQAVARTSGGTIVRVLVVDPQRLGVDGAEAPEDAAVAGRPFLERAAVRSQADLDVHGACSRPGSPPASEPMVNMVNLGEPRPEGSSQTAAFEL